MFHHSQIITEHLFAVFGLVAETMEVSKKNVIPSIPCRVYSLVGKIGIILKLKQKNYLEYDANLARKINTYFAWS